MTDDLRYQWSARHQGSTCIACGSLVVDTDAHDRWHAALEQRAPKPTVSVIGKRSRAVEDDPDAVTAHVVNWVQCDGRVVPVEHCDVCWPGPHGPYCRPDRDNCSQARSHARIEAVRRGADADEHPSTTSTLGILHAYHDAMAAAAEDADQERRGGIE